MGPDVWLFGRFHRGNQHVRSLRRLRRHGVMGVTAIAAAVASASSFTDGDVSRRSIRCSASVSLAMTRSSSVVSHCIETVCMFMKKLLQGFRRDALRDTGFRRLEFALCDVVVDGPPADMKSLGSLQDGAGFLRHDAAKTPSSESLSAP